jgi:hypothetical protein
VLSYPAMDRRKQLSQAVEEAERELEAAKRLSDARAAAKKLQRARAELRWFEEEEAKQPQGPTNRARGRASS